jgi:hypothetical protein
MAWCFQICTTCIGAASSELRNIDFPVVFLDEASMATEPASLIPLMKGVSDGLLYETWSVHESPAVTTCGFDRRSQAAATCDKKS